MCGRSFEELFHPTSCLIPVVTSSFVATQLKHSSAVDSLSLAAPLLVYYIVFVSDFIISGFFSVMMSLPCSESFVYPGTYSPHLTALAQLYLL